MTSVGPVESGPYLFEREAGVRVLSRQLAPSFWARRTEADSSRSARRTCSWRSSSRAFQSSMSHPWPTRSSSMLRCMDNAEHKNQPEWMGRLREAAVERPRTRFRKIAWADLQKLLQERDLLWHDATPKTRDRLESLRNSNK